MAKKCLKCGYERRPTDMAPDYECPGCGAIYAKVEAALNLGSVRHEPKACPFCGRSNPADHRKCSACGRLLSGDWIGRI